MGKFDFEIDPGFLRQLGRMADVEKIAPKMIDEAMPILERHVKSELAKHRRTGDMLGSVKKTRSKKNSAGNYYAVVRPTGKNREGVRNMEVLAHLEFGHNRKDGTKSPPTKILSQAIEDSREAVYDKMQEVYSREIGGDK